MIDVINLKKSFGDLHVLRGVNMSIKPGEKVCIIGPSGSGKSTLLRCINLLEYPNGGDILFKKQSILDRKNNVNKTRSKIGMVFQSFNLFNNKDVIDNCTLGPTQILRMDRKIAEEKAMSLLDRVGMKDFALANVNTLSGGQKQRVAIARALMNEPQILLCDEATSALDPDTTNQVLALLKELNQKLGLTIIMISHQINVIESICNKVAILSNSKLVENGELSDVFLNPKTDIAKKLIYTNHVKTKLDEEKILKKCKDIRITGINIITGIIEKSSRAGYTDDLSAAWTDFERKSRLLH